MSKEPWRVNLEIALQRFESNAAQYPDTSCQVYGFPPSGGAFWDLFDNYIGAKYLDASLVPLVDDFFTQDQKAFASGSRVILVKGGSLKDAERSTSGAEKPKSVGDHLRLFEIAGPGQSVDVFQRDGAQAGQWLVELPECVESACRIAIPPGKQWDWRDALSYWASCLFELVWQEPKNAAWYSPPLALGGTFGDPTYYVSDSYCPPVKFCEEDGGLAEAELDTLAAKRGWEVVRDDPSAVPGRRCWVGSKIRLRLRDGRNTLSGECDWPYTSKLNDVFGVSVWAINRLLKVGEEPDEGPKDDSRGKADSLVSWAAESPAGGGGLAEAADQQKLEEADLVAERASEAGEKRAVGKPHEQEPDEAKQKESRPKWYHEAHEEPPPEFKTKSLPGTNKELSICLGGSKKAKTPRMLRAEAKRKEVWVRRLGPQSWEVFFRTQEAFARANAKMMELQRVKQKSTASWIGGGRKTP